MSRYLGATASIGPSTNNDVFNMVGRHAVILCQVDPTLLI